MAPKKLFAAVLGAGLAASAAQAQNCVAGWGNASGGAETRSVVLDLSSPARLDRSSFPEKSETIACARPSIVPDPDDVRVLIELSLAFGVVDEAGRSLWIYAEDGRLKTQLDDGKLSSAEKAGVKAWLEAAQLRFTAALAEAGAD